jgi:hypothetical protein
VGLTVSDTACHYEIARRGFVNRGAAKADVGVATPSPALASVPFHGAGPTWPPTWPPTGTSPT